MAIIINFEHQEHAVYIQKTLFVMKIYMGFHGSFMDTFTGIPECISCKFKWVFMAIFFIGFEHQEYRSVYNTNLNGFLWQF